jgi:thiamine pyrophosphokinase
MSSHHIVREKQEPALLVLSLNHFADEDLGQLLEWSPTLIASPEVAEQLTVYGIKVDYVIADTTGELQQSNIKLIALNSNSTTHAALNYLVTNGYPAVNVVTNELDLAVYENYAHQINLVIFYKGQKIYPVTSGFRKWKPANETLAIISSNVYVKTEGLQQTAPQQYQTLNDGFFSLTFDEPYIFIAETY